MTTDADRSLEAVLALVAIRLEQYQAANYEYAVAAKAADVDRMCAALIRVTNASRLYHAALDASRYKGAR